MAFFHVVFLVRVEGFSALVGLNSAFFRALDLLELLLQMLLHLALIHIFDFLNDKIRNRGRTSIRIVIVDIDIVVVYDLNYFRRVALS